MYPTDKSYGGPVNVTNRVLTLLSAQGHIVRGRPRGGWTSGQFTWFAVGDQRPDLGPAAARTELACRWLSAFGPALVSDLQWWTGLTAGQVRQALAELDLTEVDLHGSPGVMLAADVPGLDAQADADPGPWPALPPALDPTAMGWRERAWYVGEHTAALFDRSGEDRPDGLVGRPDRGRLGAAPRRRDRGPAARGRRGRGRRRDSSRGPAAAGVGRTRHEDHPPVPDPTGTRARAGERQLSTSRSGCCPHRPVG